MWSKYKNSTNIDLKNFGAEFELDQLNGVKHHSQAWKELAHLTIWRI